jgi:ABC-type transporter Mla maintaining outer membrane lipid asymmetry ATPase subunit MlaF
MTATILDRIADPLPRTSCAGAAVTLRKVTKSFGAHSVLRGIDLEIEAGAFVAIVVQRLW